MRKIRHVIESQQWDREGLEELFQLARVMREDCARYPRSRRHARCLEGYLMASLFYEESTRTRFSHEAAMMRLGGRFISTENAKEFSSVAKGESLEDTIRTIARMVDVIVLRHVDENTAARAAAAMDEDRQRLGRRLVPVINAGDGPGQHPTQALLDVFTIVDRLGSLDGKTIAFVGDLLYGRTVHSLAYLAGKFCPFQLVFVSDPLVRMPQGIKDYLDRHGVAWQETEDLKEAAQLCQVLYVTRVQKARFSINEPGISEQERRKRQAAYERVFGRYVVGPAVTKLMRPDSIVMHPFPRVNEISTEVDCDPRAAYFDQIENGLYIRMALLHNILNQDCY